MTTGPLVEINQVIVSGKIISHIHMFMEKRTTKLVFTLETGRGRFYIQWYSPNWQPQQSDHIMVHGNLYSQKCRCKQAHSGRIQAREITLLKRKR